MIHRLWKAESVPNSGEDLFHAIITAEEGKCLIAQVCSLDDALEMAKSHNEHIDALISKAQTPQGHSN